MRRAMKSTVSLLALAAASLLAGACTTAAADTEQSAPAAATTAETQATPAAGAQPTAADADAFVARAERELGEFSVLSSRAQWVNATYITEDTDALAAHFGTVGTQMQVRLANEAARYTNVPVATPRPGASSTSCAARSSCPRPRRPGAAAELNTIAPACSRPTARAAAR
jgi:peptidyl-dipeptidase A